MNANSLETVQSALAERGVKDVKFYFNTSVFEKPHSEVSQGISYILETYLRGDCSPLKPLNDSNK